MALEDMDEADNASAIIPCEFTDIFVLPDGDPMECHQYVVYSYWGGIALIGILLVLVLILIIAVCCLCSSRRRGRFILKSSHGQRRDSTLITGRTNVKVEVLELERSIQLEEAPSLQEEIVPANATPVVRNGDKKNTPVTATTVRVADKKVSPVLTDKKISQVPAKAADKKISPVHTTTKAAEKKISPLHTTNKAAEKISPVSATTKAAEAVAAAAAVTTAAEESEGRTKSTRIESTILYDMIGEDQYLMKERLEESYESYDDEDDEGVNKEGRRTQSVKYSKVAKEVRLKMMGEGCGVLMHVTDPPAQDVVKYSKVAKKIRLKMEEGKDHGVLLHEADTPTAESAGMSTHGEYSREDGPGAATVRSTANATTASAGLANKVSSPQLISAAAAATSPTITSPHLEHVAPPPTTATTTAEPLNDSNRREDADFDTASSRDSVGLTTVERIASIEELLCDMCKSLESIADADEAEFSGDDTASCNCSLSSGLETLPEEEDLHVHNV